MNMDGWIKYEVWNYIFPIYTAVNFPFFNRIATSSFSYRSIVVFSNFILVEVKANSNSKVQGHFLGMTLKRLWGYSCFLCLIYRLNDFYVHSTCVCLISKIFLKILFQSKKFNENSIELLKYKILIFRFKSSPKLNSF